MCEPLPDDPGRALGSMGIYVFNTRVMFELLCEDAARPESGHDFGKDIIPGMIAGGARVYAHAASGFSVITSASGGYLLSYPFASALTGWLAERRWDRRFSSAIGAMLTGNVVVYLIGLPWLAAVLHTNLESTLELGLYPFVPGDLFKLYLAAAALPAAWRLVQRADE